MLASLFAKVEPGLEHCRAFYAGRAVREQRALLALGGFLACVLFYALLLAPLDHHRMRLRAEIQRDQKTLAWMQAVDHALSSGVGQARTQTHTVVDALAGLQAGIQASPFSASLKVLKQTGEHTLRLQLEAVPFDAWLRLMSELDARYGTSIQRLSIVRAGTTPGMVNVTAVLNAGLTPASACVYDAAL